MYIDKELLFSQNQKITETANSSKALNLGSVQGNGMPIYPFVQVSEAFQGLTSLIVHIQSATKNSTPSDGEYETIMSSKKYLLEDLGAVQHISFGSLPPNAGNYLRVKYEVEGTATHGAVTAGLVLNTQVN